MPSVMNVLFEERVGGPQLRVLQVARALQDRDFKTIVIIPRGDATFASLLREAQVPFHELGLLRLRDSRNPAVHARYLVRFWPNVRAVRCLIRRHNVDVVHTNGLMHLQAAMAARLEGVRLVWHLNDTCTPRLLRWAILPLVRAWADRIAIAARAVGLYCFPDPSRVQPRLDLVHPPVDTRRFNPEVDGSPVRADLGISRDCPVIGTVTNLSPGKGVGFLLEAAPRIKARFPDAKFVVVGAPLQNRLTHWRALVRRTEELGLAKDFIFTGRRSDVPQVMRALTVYVHASESEACPMSVLEASASSLPVVATDVGGTRELVEGDVTGLLIKPRSPDQIADAVLSLLESPDRARRMGQAGVERMRRLFSLDRCVEEHVWLYAAALKTSGMGERI